MLARIRNRLALMDRRQSAKLHLHAPLASFTFDDFPASAVDVGAAILEEFNVRGTYFASAEFHEKTVDGIAYYTSEHVKRLHEAGHEIGCHAFYHLRLGSKGPAFARASIEQNRLFMRQLLGEQFIMNSFAYPYGDVSVGVKRAMSRQFALCRGVYQHANTASVDLAQISIISLESRHWDEAAMRQTIADAKRNNSWLVFLTHDISDVPTPYGSTPAMLRTTLELLKKADITCLTLKAAAGQGIFAA